MPKYFLALNKALEKMVSSAIPLLSTSTEPVLSLKFIFLTIHCNILVKVYTTQMLLSVSLTSPISVVVWMAALWVVEE